MIDFECRLNLRKFICRYYVCLSVGHKIQKKNWNLKKNGCPSVSLKIQKKKSPLHYFSSNNTFLHSNHYFSSKTITSLLLVMSIYLSVTKSKKKKWNSKKMWSELNWIELNWSELKWSELNWSEVKWSEVKWSELRLNWIELNWSELKWSEVN